MSGLAVFAVSLLTAPPPEKIPNGNQEESVHARAVFRQLAENSNISLAYVSGRDKKLILDAIEEFYLPLPDYAIGDVGTILKKFDKSSVLATGKFFRHEWQLRCRRSGGLGSLYT
jgi:hypothetical protein